MKLSKQPRRTPLPLLQLLCPTVILPLDKVQAHAQDLPLSPFEILAPCPQDPAAPHSPCARPQHQCPNSAVLLAHIRLLALACAECLLPVKAFRLRKAEGRHVDLEDHCPLKDIPTSRHRDIRLQVQGRCADLLARRDPLRLAQVIQVLGVVDPHLRLKDKLRVGSSWNKGVYSIWCLRCPYLICGLTWVFLFCILYIIYVHVSSFGRLVCYILRIPSCWQIFRLPFRCCFFCKYTRSSSLLGFIFHSVICDPKIVSKHD